MKVGDRVELDGPRPGRHQGTIERIHNENVYIAMDDGGRRKVQPKEVMQIGHNYLKTLK